MEFLDRRDAGRKLADKLFDLHVENPVVVALPRGGVPVGFEISKRLGAPLDVFVVKKMGAPDNPELALGAITEDGTYWWNNSLIDELGVSEDYLRKIKIEKHRQALELAQDLRCGRTPVQVNGKTVILVDDGLATGATALAAVELLKKREAGRVILAVPVSSPRTGRLLKRHVDQVIFLKEPENLFSVGSWYRDFTQVSDLEVKELLRQRGTTPSNTAGGQEVSIQAGVVRLMGELHIPKSAKGIVLFVHGSGSSRKSPRNRGVARALQEVGFGTLLFDLLTPEEANDGQNVFNIRLMTERTLAATQWVRSQLESHHLPIGYFGSSTGAAAALCASAEPGNSIFAVVCRGGRPDLASHCLTQVQAPTLLLVGGNDPVVLGFNRYAKSYLSSVELVIIPHAGHLFEEPGALEKVTEQTQSWFLCQIAVRQSQMALTSGPLLDPKKAGITLPVPNHRVPFSI